MVLADGQFRFIFTAKDFQASVRFYQDILDLPVDHSWDYGPGDRGFVFLAARGMIEILARAPGVEYIKPQAGGLLVQVDDADTEYQQLKNKGANIVQEPTTFPWGHRIVRVADPDGIVISLFSVVESPQAG